MDQTAQVQKIITPTPETRSFFQKNLTKIIFGVLGIIVLIELVIGVRTLIGGTSQNSSVPKIQSMTNPKIIIRPDMDNVKAGQIIEVKAIVSTGGKLTDSTDLILNYDPKFLEASSSAIKTGLIYQDYPVAVVDQTLGEIAISGITPPNGNPFEGIGTLATLYFKALKNGKTALTVNFQNGATADSNVVLSGTTDDILEQVFNAEINIGGQSSGSSQSASCDGYTQYCQTYDGKTGRQFCSRGKKEAFSCVFDPKLTVSCDVCNAN